MSEAERNEDRLDRCVMLLPCPFCGSRQRVEHVGRDWYRLDSENHDPNCIIWGVNLGEYPQSDENRQYLIDSWNNRAT